MDSSHDVLLRSALALAAAAAAFMLVILAWRLRLRPSRRDLLFAAAVYSLAFLASAAPLVASALGREPRAALPATILLYASALLAAVVALRRRASFAVLAAVVALLFRVLFDILFAAAYGLIIK